MPVRRPVADLPGSPVTSAVVFGDTHGDWRSTAAACERFLRSPSTTALVGLGDYIDRPPDDCGEGSVANSLYLLSLAAEFPDRVVLLKGNHETHRLIPVLPHDLPEEVDHLWGPEIERYARIMGLLERGALAAVTSNGVYLAHGGFPQKIPVGNWRDAFDPRDSEQLLDIVWGDCAASRSHRGIAIRFDERDLDRFFAATTHRIFVRGHDPDLAGRSVYHKRCLTLHTTRIYERFGGVLIARIPLNQPVVTSDDFEIEHLETEGHDFPSL